ncbi:hypothetical protein Y032_0027g1519 [Ancylostoma ceylanicum]|uniref:Uncharacterized protein n=1 Tax=Ancylostoma ceylanicum TaxID=53326 RepID=A0A016UTC4_9BILA|nr:hypothetical protein Y032_0027g1519 [Ancylostoma ceylanicum]
MDSSTCSFLISERVETSLTLKGGPRRWVYTVPTTATTTFLLPPEFIFSSEIEEQYAALIQMLSTLNPVQQTNNVNCNYYDYYKNLLSYVCTLSDPGFLTTLLQSLDPYGMGVRTGMHQAQQHHHHMMGQSVSPNPIPHANLHQYLTAAAMLNSAPFPTDGSGDGPKNKIRNSA